jgi:hypothetical protein
MAKRDSGGKRTNTATANTTTGSDAAANDAMEQRVVAFAEQLGRVVGTVQAKTEGWMDRDTLNKQIAGVRDSAAELLEQLKTTVTRATIGAKASTKKASAAASKSKGRSGGVVDAPGKKHRKPTPADPRAMAADAKASNIRSGKASMKTMKQRGRG